jgi:DNA-binding Lrp family transcriptional regulator
MSDSTQPDELDLVLLHALQIAPRAPWEQLADVIGVSAATLARRWARLSGRGDAWISAYTTSQEGGGALVEIDCDANTAPDVAVAVSSDSRAVNVDVTAGGRDLLVGVITESIPDLSHFLRKIQIIPGIRSARTHVITGIVKDASRWRLDALEPGQVRKLEAASAKASGAFHELDDVGIRLIAALSLDGRMSAVELAERLSVSVNTVRRRMAQLESSDWLRVRCDVTRAVTGHGIAATFWLSVPPVALRDAARSIAEILEVRAVFYVAGPQNLAVLVWLRHPKDLPDFEVELIRRAPTAVISDRVVTLQTVKHVGRLLDDEGRVSAVIPWRPGPS